jgi:hypothetical protein
MTTGRINQVTTIRNTLRCLNSVLLAPSRGFSLGWSSSMDSKGGQPFKTRDVSKTVTTSPPSALGRTSKSCNPQSNHLVPRSHKIQAHFSLSSKGQGSWPSVRTTSNRQCLKGLQQSRRIPEWLFEQQV